MNDLQTRAMASPLAQAGPVEARQVLKNSPYNASVALSVNR